MTKELNEILERIPKSRRSKIEKRYQNLAVEVEGLAALRALSGKMQSDIAKALSIKQPTVSRIEKQTDLYLSTLRDYVEALGGELEIIMKLPNGASYSITRFGSDH